MPYKYYQESAGGGRTDSNDNADEYNLINELRQIVEDLALLLGHSKLNDGLYPKDGSAGGALSNLPKCNYAATVVPTVNNDSSQGYSVGSRWLGTVLGDEYVCYNASAGAAVWKKVSAEGIENITGTIEIVMDISGTVGAGITELMTSTVAVVIDVDGDLGVIMSMTATANIGSNVVGDLTVI